jgi:SAM-dependent methyltransferase
MYETSKALLRRLGDSRFATRYFVGNGIDIGAGPDPLAQYAEQFPLMQSCRSWDVADGDAETLSSVADGSLDFAHASHCLEHMTDPARALSHWLRVLRPGGHLIVTVPDEDLYEQGVFPSTYNADHKWTFTIGKTRSWSPVSINLLPLMQSLTATAEVIKIERLDAGQRYLLPRFDQTSTPVAECAIEFILRRLTADDMTRLGRLPPA